MSVCMSVAKLGFPMILGRSLILFKVQNNEREKKRHARSFIRYPARSFIRLLTNELAGIVLYA